MEGKEMCGVGGGGGQDWGLGNWKLGPMGGMGADGQMAPLIAIRLTAERISMSCLSSHFQGRKWYGICVNPMTRVKEGPAMTSNATAAVAFDTRSFSLNNFKWGGHIGTST